jgi:hypothetical protein
MPIYAVWLSRYAFSAAGDLQQAAREVEHHVSWVRYVWEGREDELASDEPIDPRRTS